MTIDTEKTSSLAEYTIKRESTYFKLIVDAPKDFTLPHDTRATGVSLQFDGIRHDSAADDPFV